MANYEKMVSFGCSNEMYSKLKALCLKQDRSMGWVMRKAFESYLAAGGK